MTRFEWIFLKINFFADFAFFIGVFSSPTYLPWGPGRGPTKNWARSVLAVRLPETNKHSSHKVVFSLCMSDQHAGTLLIELSQILIGELSRTIGIFLVLFINSKSLISMFRHNSITDEVDIPINNKVKKTFPFYIFNISFNIFEFPPLLPTLQKSIFYFICSVT